MIALGSDHGGYDLKMDYGHCIPMIAAWWIGEGICVMNLGQVEIYADGVKTGRGIDAVIATCAAVKQTVWLQKVYLSVNG